MIPGPEYRVKKEISQKKFLRLFILVRMYARTQTIRIIPIISWMFFAATSAAQMRRPVKTETAVGGGSWTGALGGAGTGVLPFAGGAGGTGVIVLANRAKQQR